MSNLFRARFKANKEDPRPVNWPVQHPYWISGQGDDYSIVISYCGDQGYINKNWPDAHDIEMEAVDDYVFTDRFQKPDWFKIKEVEE